MRTSKFVNLDPNVLLEYIYDSDNLIFEDYQILINTIDDSRGFLQQPETNQQQTVTNNTANLNLFEIDSNTNKWAPVDNVTYPFLQFQDFPGNIPVRYDIVRLHFPVSYNFDDKLGFVLNVRVANATNTEYYDLTNYFFDNTDVFRSLDLTAPPFVYNEVMWGKYVEIQIPSPKALSEQITTANNLSQTVVPIQGSMNFNLVGPNQNGVSDTSPIFVDFYFITKKEEVFGNLQYTVRDPYSTTVPVTPEFEEISVNIDAADNGDFFNIYSTYNGSSSEFEAWIDQQQQLGFRYYVTYTVSVVEKNVQTDSVQYIVQDNFDDFIRFRPIVTFSTTTAAIDVEMKLVNAIDNNFILRRSTYTMLQDEVAKYSANLTKIDLENAFKPKIYNATPDLISYVNRESNEVVEKIDVPFPVMFDRYSVVAKNVNEEVDDTTYYGIGQLQILLYPFDNVVVIVIAKDKNESGIEPLQIPEGAQVLMSFKSNTDIVEVELYNDSGLVDFENGTVAFKIPEAKMPSLVDFYKAGYDQFYIQYKTVETDTNTVIYAGRFLVYNEF